MNVFNFDFQEWIQFILQKVGSGVTLALVSVGLQLRFESRSQHWQFWTWSVVCNFDASYNLFIV
jgi:hypothetical protein